MTEVAQAEKEFGHLNSTEAFEAVQKVIANTAAINSMASRHTNRTLTCGAGPVSDPVVPEAASGKVHRGVELGPPLVIMEAVAALGVAILKLSPRDGRTRGTAGLG
jgi:hypothetical protein